MLKKVHFTTEIYTASEQQTKWSFDAAVLANLSEWCEPEWNFCYARDPNRTQSQIKKFKKMYFRIIWTGCQQHAGHHADPHDHCHKTETSFSLKFAKKKWVCLSLGMVRNIRSFFFERFKSCFFKILIIFGTTLSTQTRFPNMFWRHPPKRFCKRPSTQNDFLRQNTILQKVIRYFAPCTGLQQKWS